MRPIAIQIVGFIYLISISAYAMDLLIFEHIDMRPVGFDGELLDTDMINSSANPWLAADDKILNASGDDLNIIERVGRFIESTYASVWIYIHLATGTYAFTLLGNLGMPGELVLLFQLIMPLIVVVTVVYMLSGRH